MEYQAGDTTKPNRLRLAWSAPKRNKRPTVLIAEDDNALRRLYAAYLADTFKVQTASNGHKALQQLNTGGIDLVLSDIRMPRISDNNRRHGLDSGQ